MSIKFLSFAEAPCDVQVTVSVASPFAAEKVTLLLTFSGGTSSV